MKRCPTCRYIYTDETLNFCRHDGAALTPIPPSSENLTKLINPMSPDSDAVRRRVSPAEALPGDAVQTSPSLPAEAGRRPETKYARSGGVNIAYQVIGEGALDLVYVMGWVSHLDHFWEDPSYARFLNRLASFSRLILFDKRGTGLSDRVHESELPTLEQRMDDVRAVMDAVGSARAALFGVSEGGRCAPCSPQRTRSAPRP